MAGCESSGLYLYARQESNGKSFCFVIGHVIFFEMTLTFLPHVDMLEYQKLE